jgi:hypothetical protein
MPLGDQGCKSLRRASRLNVSHFAGIDTKLTQGLHGEIVWIAADAGYADPFALEVFGPLDIGFGEYAVGQDVFDSTDENRICCSGFGIPWGHVVEQGFDAAGSEKGGCQALRFPRLLEEALKFSRSLIKLGLESQTHHREVVYERKYRLDSDP